MGHMFPCFSGNPMTGHAMGLVNRNTGYPPPFRESTRYWDDNLNSTVAIKYDTVPHRAAGYYY